MANYRIRLVRMGELGPHPPPLFLMSSGSDLVQPTLPGISVKYAHTYAQPFLLIELPLNMICPVTLTTLTVT